MSLQYPGKQCSGTHNAQEKKPAPRDLHNTEDHEESPALREVSAVIKIKMSNRRLPLCRNDVGLHLALVQRRSPTSPEISQPRRSLMGNPSLNSPKLQDPRSQKKKKKCEVSPRTSMLANESCISLWVVGQNFRLLPLGLLVPHSSPKLPSPARGCCLPWIWLHVHWKGLDFFPSLLCSCPLASCWDLECATLQVFSFNDS